MPNRLTLRLTDETADAMNKLCESSDPPETQRQFVEAALEREFALPPVPGQPKPVRSYRTGVWIDPALVSELDYRVSVEHKNQVEIVERAVEREIERRRTEHAEVA